jgi:hypothetical protein
MSERIMLERRQLRLHEAAAAIRRLEAPVIGLITVAAGYYTYLGVSAIAPENDVYAKAGYALFAAAVSAGLYALWRAVMAQVPLLKAGGRVLAVPIIFAVIVFAAGVSTFFNVTGMVGAEAVAMHMHASLEGFSDATAAASSQAQDGLRDAAALKLNQAKFERMAESERSNGGLSGGAGVGAVSGMLEQVSAVFAAAAREADDKIRKSELLGRDAEKSLAAMRALVEDPALSLRVRTAKFADVAESLRLTLLELSRLEVASTIRQAVAASRELVKPALSSNKAVAARQSATIGELQRMLADQESLVEAAGKTVANPLLGKPYQAITVYTAVIRHWMEFLPAALAALFVDLLPLPLLAMSCLVESALARNAANAARRFSTGELIPMTERPPRRAAVVLQPADATDDPYEPGSA